MWMSPVIVIVMVLPRANLSDPPRDGNDDVTMKENKTSVESMLDLSSSSVCENTRETRNKNM
jgi:hypothetical protein